MQFECQIGSSSRTIKPEGSKNPAAANNAITLGRVPAQSANDRSGKVRFILRESCGERRQR